MNINQEQQQNVINGNIQGNVPQQQDDPPLIINQHYLPRGDLTISSNISFVNSSVNAVIVPLVAMPSLFRQEFDNNEENFSVNSGYATDYVDISPNPHVQIPNIARYIGYIISGIQIDVKFEESILICCKCYLNGTMEILPNGTFRYLNQPRNGLTRRYSLLCKIIYHSISQYYYEPTLDSTTLVAEMQGLMQDLYDNSTYTSVLTTIKPYVFNGVEYTITKSALRRWATTIPWHALIFNSQSPLGYDDFLDLFFKMFSINQGKALRYIDTHPNIQRVQSIVPNSSLFTRLNPTHMESYEINYAPVTTTRFILFCRYMQIAITSTLDWHSDDSDDEELSSEDDIDTEKEIDSEEDEQSILAN